MAGNSPKLHRDDPEKDPLVGHVKVTRDDWLNAARDVLVNDGVGEIKILPLAALLGVSRSSFYGYFENRDDLLHALLEEWEQRNTQSILTNCALPSTSIDAACCNFFCCFIDPGQFDQGLDFAVREWARRDPDVRARIDRADRIRLEAVTAMFARHDYPQDEADARARILYYMQLGYHALDVREGMETRLARVAAYLNGFTGRPRDKGALDGFFAFARQFEER